LNLDITYSDGCSVKRPRLHPAAPEQIKNRPPSDIADYLLPCVAARPRAPVHYGADGRRGEALSRRADKKAADASQDRDAGVAIALLYIPAS